MCTKDVSFKTGDLKGISQKENLSESFSCSDKSDIETYNPLAVLVPRMKHPSTDLYPRPQNSTTPAQPTKSPSTKTPPPFRNTASDHAS